MGFPGAQPLAFLCCSMRVQLNPISPGLKQLLKYFHLYKLMRSLIPIDFFPSPRSSLSYTFINLLFILSSCHSYNMHWVQKSTLYQDGNKILVLQSIWKNNILLAWQEKMTFSLTRLSVVLCLKALVNLTKEEILIYMEICKSRCRQICIYID